MSTSYIPVRSAFQWIEYPLHKLSGNWINSSSTLQACSLYAAGAVIYPVVLCATPVTMVADIVIGIAETAFCLGRHSLREAREVAKKKILIAPLHQFTFLSLSLGGVSSAVLLIASLKGKISIGMKIDKISWLLIPALFLAAFSFPGIQDQEIYMQLKSMSPRMRRLIHNPTNFVISTTTIAILTALEFRMTRSSSYPAPVWYVIGGVALAWLLSHTQSQMLIGSFSPSWNQKVFSIFNSDPLSNSGFKGYRLEDWDGEAEYEKYRQTFAKQRYFRESLRPKPRLQRPPPPQPSQSKNYWDEALRVPGDFEKIQPCTPDEPQLYREFKQRVLDGKQPAELLGVSENPTARELKQAYNKYGRVIHVDKHSGSPEAKILFQCLNIARERLSASENEESFWKTFLGRDYYNINHDARIKSPNEDYADFKGAIRINDSFKELLRLPVKFTKENIEQAYQKYRIALNFQGPEASALNRCLDKARTLALQDFASRPKSYWDEALKGDFEKIQPCSPDEPQLYQEFKQGVLDGTQPAELLGVSENPTAKELKQAHNKYSRAIHENKRSGSQEGKILFQCLNIARERLSASENEEPFWKTFLGNDDYYDINHDPGTKSPNEDYADFKGAIRINDSFKELLRLPNGFTEENIEQAYQKYRVALNFPGPEASALNRCLDKARTLALQDFASRNR